MKTEEMARRVKMDLEMRDPEFDVDFWAVREDSAEMKTAETESNKESSESLRRLKGSRSWTRRSVFSAR